MLGSPLTLQTLVVRMITDTAAFEAGLGNAETMLMNTTVRINQIMAVFSFRMASSLTHILTEFDDMMTKIISISNGGGAALRRDIEKTIVGISSQSITGPQALAKAYYEMTRAGYGAAKSMEALQTVERFSVVNGLEAGEAARQLTRLQRGLGISIEDATANAASLQHIGDVISAVQVRSQITADGLVHSIMQLAPALQFYNVSLEQGAAMMGALAANGNNAGEALRVGRLALEEFTRLQAHSEGIVPGGGRTGPAQRQTAGGRATGNQGFRSGSAGHIARSIAPLHNATSAVAANTAAWQRLGISMLKADGTMKELPQMAMDINRAFTGMTNQEKIANLIELGFNRLTVDSVLKIIQAADAMHEFYDAAKEADGIMETIYSERMNSLSSQFALLTNRLHGIAIEIGRYLTPFLKVLNNIILVTVGYWNGLSENTKKIIFGISALVIAILSLNYILPMLRALWDVLIGTFIRTPYNIVKAGVLGIAYALLFLYHTAMIIASAGTLLYLVFRTVNRVSLGLISMSVAVRYARPIFGRFAGIVMYTAYILRTVFVGSILVAMYALAGMLASVVAVTGILQVAFGSWPTLVSGVAKINAVFGSFAYGVIIFAFSLRTGVSAIRGVLSTLASMPSWDWSGILSNSYAQFAGWQNGILGLVLSLVNTFPRTSAAILNFFNNLSSTLSGVGAVVGFLFSRTTAQLLANIAIIQSSFGAFAPWIIRTLFQIRFAFNSIFYGISIPTGFNFSGILGSLVNGAAAVVARIKAFRLAVVAAWNSGQILSVLFFPFRKIEQALTVGFDILTKIVMVGMDAIAVSWNNRSILRAMIFPFAQIWKGLILGFSTLTTAIVIGKKTVATVWATTLAVKAWFGSTFTSALVVVENLWKGFLSLGTAIQSFYTTSLKVPGIIGRITEGIEHVFSGSTRALHGFYQMTLDGLGLVGAGVALVLTGFQDFYTKKSPPYLLNYMKWVFRYLIHDVKYFATGLEDAFHGLYSLRLGFGNLFSLGVQQAGKLLETIGQSDLYNAMMNPIRRFITTAKNLLGNIHWLPAVSTRGTLFQRFLLDAQMFWEHMKYLWYVGTDRLNTIMRTLKLDWLITAYTGISHRIAEILSSKTMFEMLNKTLGMMVSPITSALGNVRELVVAGGSKIVRAFYWLRDSAVGVFAKNTFNSIVTAYDNAMQAIHLAVSRGWVGIYAAWNQFSNLPIVRPVVSGVVAAYDAILFGLHARILAGWANVKSTWDSIGILPKIKVIANVAFASTFLLLRNKIVAGWSSIKATWAAIGILPKIKIATDVILSSIFTPIRDKIIAGWSGIKAIWASISILPKITIVATATISVFQKLKDTIVAGWSAIHNAWKAGGIFPAIKLIIASPFTTVFGFLKERITSGWNAIHAAWTAGGIFPTIKLIIVSPFTTVFGFLKERITSGWNAIHNAWKAGGIFPKIVLAILTPVMLVFGFLKERIVDGWNAIHNAWKAGGIFPAIKLIIASPFTTVFGFLKERITSGWNGIHNAWKAGGVFPVIKLIIVSPFTTVFGFLKEWITSGWNAIHNAWKAGGIFPKIVLAILTPVMPVFGFLGNRIAAGWGFVHNAWKAGNNFLRIKVPVPTSVGNIFNRLGDGIAAGWSAIHNAWKAGNNFLRIKIPVPTSVGNIFDRLGNGITAGWSAIHNAWKAGNNFLRIKIPVPVIVSNLFTKLGKQITAGWVMIHDVWKIGGILPAINLTFMLPIIGIFGFLKNKIKAGWNVVYETWRAGRFFPVIHLVAIVPLIRIFGSLKDTIVAGWTTIHSAWKSGGIFPVINLLIVSPFMGVFNLLRSQIVAGWNAIRSAWQSGGILPVIRLVAIVPIVGLFGFLKDQIVNGWVTIHNAWKAGGILPVIRLIMTSPFTGLFGFLKDKVTTGWSAVSTAWKAGSSSITFSGFAFNVIDSIVKTTWAGIVGIGRAIQYAAQRMPSFYNGWILFKDGVVNTITGLNQMRVALGWIWKAATSGSLTAWLGVFSTGLSSVKLGLSQMATAISRSYWAVWDFGTGLLTKLTIGIGNASGLFFRLSRFTFGRSMVNLSPMLAPLKIAYGILQGIVTIPMVIAGGFYHLGLALKSTLPLSTGLGLAFNTMRVTLSSMARLSLGNIFSGLGNIGGMLIGLTRSLGNIPVLGNILKMAFAPVQIAILNPMVAVARGFAYALTNGLTAGLKLASKIWWTLSNASAEMLKAGATGLVSNVATVITSVLGLLTTIGSIGVIASIVTAIGGIAAALILIPMVFTVIIGSLVIILEMMGVFEGEVGGLYVNWQQIGEIITEVFFTIFGFFYNFVENWDRILTWFRQQWGNVLIDIASFTTTIFANIWHNFIVAMKEAFKTMIVSGAMAWDYLFRTAIENINKLIRAYNSISPAWMKKDEISMPGENVIRDRVTRQVEIVFGEAGVFRNILDGFAPLTQRVGLNLAVPPEIRDAIGGIGRGIINQLLGRDQPQQGGNTKIGDTFKEVSLQRFVLDQGSNGLQSGPQEVHAPVLEGIAGEILRQIQRALGMGPPAVTD